MNTCKNCQKEISLFHSLCDECKNALQEQELINKTKKDDETRLKIEQQKQDSIIEIKNLINVILKAITQEEILMYLFITSDVSVKEGNSGVVGTILGGALGGLPGAIIGSVITPKTYNQKGNVGIILVTKKNILIRHFQTELFSTILLSYNHLQLFLSKLSSQKSIQEINFVIENSDLSVTNVIRNDFEIISGSSKFGFNAAGIQIDDSTNYMSYSVEELKKYFRELGGICSPEEFIKELLKGNNPISGYQFANTKNEYFKRLFVLILEHENRDTIVKNFNLLLPPVRKKLENRILERARKYTGSIIGFVLLILITLTMIIAGISMLNSEGNGEKLLGFTLIIFSAIPLMGLTAGDGQRRSVNWARFCRDMVFQYDMKENN